MPFPPNFDHAWDITQPPDTQAANQLGVDIRNLKDDIMQRMSLLSGTLANRPTPETVNAVWGGAGFGLTYIATDTAQTFQWNGAAWVSLPGGFSDYDDYTPVAFIASAPAVIRTNTIPTGGVQQAQAVGSYIEIETSFNVSAFTGATPTYVLKINGVQIASFNLNTAPPANYYTKTVIALSNGSNPRSSTFFASLVTAGINRNVGALGMTDGSVPVTVSDSFGAATTISATADFMHVRVRK